MLNEQTIEKLGELRLKAMARAFREQTEDPAMAGLSFEDRFGLIVDRLRSFSFGKTGPLGRPVSSGFEMGRQEKQPNSKIDEGGDI